MHLLIEHGAAELLTQTNNSWMIPLHYFIANEYDQDHQWDQERMERYCRRMGENAAMMINKGIGLQVEGEYGFGGLLCSSSNQEVKDRIY